MASSNTNHSGLFSRVLSFLSSSFSLFSSSEKSPSARPRPNSAPPQTLSEQLEKQIVFPVAKFPSSRATVDTASWNPQLADSQTRQTLLPPRAEENDLHEGFPNSSCDMTMMERDVVPYATIPSSLRSSHISGANNSGDNIHRGQSEFALAHSDPAHYKRNNNSLVIPPYRAKTRYGSTPLIPSNGYEQRRAEGSPTLLCTRPTESHSTQYARSSTEFVPPNSVAQIGTLPEAVEENGNEEFYDSSSETHGQKRDAVSVNTTGPSPLCVANLCGAQGSRVQTTRPSTEFAQTNSVFPPTTRTHNPRGSDTYSAQPLYVRTSPMLSTEHGRQLSANLSGAACPREELARTPIDFANANSIQHPTTRAHNSRGNSTYSTQPLYVRNSPMLSTEHGASQHARIRSVVTFPTQGVRAPFREEGEQRVQTRHAGRVPTRVTNVDIRVYTLPLSVGILQH